MRVVGLVVCKRIKTIVCGCSGVQLSCRKRLLACNRAWSVEQPWWLVVEARCRSAIPFACRATWTVTRRHKPTRNPAQSSSRATGLNNSSTYTCNLECNHPFLIISRSFSAILCSKDSQRIPSAPPTTFGILAETQQLHILELGANAKKHLSFERALTRRSQSKHLV